jgi:hypothetical protein
VAVWASPTIETCIGILGVLAAGAAAIRSTRTSRPWSSRPSLPHTSGRARFASFGNSRAIRWAR